MSVTSKPETAELNQFVENFVVAVDFQTPISVTPDTELNSLPEWDSLAALGVIVMSDTEYGVSITGNDLKGCLTVGDIYTSVRNKKAG